MGLITTNNALSTLAAAISVGTTTLTVQAADAAKFPTPAAGDWFPVTLVDGVNLEIVRCTARAGAVLTVARGQEGTAARAFPIGARVSHRLTSNAIATLLQDPPADGKQYARKNGAWDAVLVVAIGDNPPASPAIGQLWWESDTGNLFIWYDDGNSVQWVPTNVGALPDGSGGGGSGLPAVVANAIVYGRWNDGSGEVWRAAVDRAGDTMGGALSIWPATGAGNFTVKSNDSSVFAQLDKVAGTSGLAALDIKAGGSRRWRWEYADSLAESGGNAGANFNLRAYQDNGITNAIVLAINRASGLITVFADPTAPLGIATKQYVDTGLGGKAATVHTHAQADVTNLVTDLAGKAPTVHTHAQSDVTGLPAALTAKLDASAYTAADVLTKIKTVDGAGSGLDAELVGGKKFTVASTAPSSPATGDVWIDTT